MNKVSRNPSRSGSSFRFGACLLVMPILILGMACHLILRPYERAAKQLEFRLVSVSISKPNGVITGKLALMADLEVINPSETDLVLKEHQVELVVTHKDAHDPVRLGHLSIPDTASIPSHGSQVFSMRWEVSLLDAPAITKAAWGSITQGGTTFRVKGSAKARLYGVMVPVNYDLFRKEFEVRL